MAAPEDEAPRPRIATPSVRAVERRAWIAAWMAAAALLWAAGGMVAFALEGRTSGAALAAWGIAPALALGVTLAAAGRESAPARRATHVLLAVALVLAVAGHLLHPRGAPLRPLVPPRVGTLLVGTPWAGVALAAFAALALPFLVGAYLHALRLTLDVAGATPARLRWGLDLRLTSADDVPRPRASRLDHALRLWGTGLALPGRLALHVGEATLRRGLALLTGRRVVLVRATVDLEALARAQEDARATPLPAGMRLTFDAGSVRLERSRAFLPHEADETLWISGAPEAVARLREALEERHADLATWSRSRVARRIERALDALVAQARVARSVEERAALLEESARLGRAITARSLREEEAARVALRKAQRAQILLQDLLLREATTGEPATRLVAPAPTLNPSIDVLVQAGGLAQARRVLHAPHWIVPARTPRGDVDLVVPALAQRLDLDESHALAEALLRAPPRLLLEGRREAAFLPPAPPTAALAGEARRARADVEPATLDESHLELVYVPLVPTAQGWRDAVTGRPAPPPDEVRARRISRHV